MICVHLSRGTAYHIRSSAAVRISDASASTKAVLLAGQYHMLTHSKLSLEILAASRCRKHTILSRATWTRSMHRACSDRPCAAPHAQQQPAMMSAASTTSKGVSYLELPDRKLAYIHTLAQPAAAAAADTTIMFCPGLMSDMQGRKPSALAAYAAAQGCSCVRFDYRGHGLSSGSFSDCHLGMW